MAHDLSHVRIHSTHIHAEGVSETARRPSKAGSLPKECLFQKEGQPPESATTDKPLLEYGKGRVPFIRPLKTNIVEAAAPPALLSEVIPPAALSISHSAKIFENHAQEGYFESALHFGDYGIPRTESSEGQPPKSATAPISDVRELPTKSRIPFILPKTASVAAAEPLPALHAGKDRTVYEHHAIEAAPTKNTTAVRTDPLAGVRQYNSKKDLENHLLKGAKESFDRTRADVTVAQEACDDCQKDAFYEKSKRAERGIWKLLTEEPLEDLKNYLVTRSNLKNAQANLKKAQSHQDRALQGLVTVFNATLDVSLKSTIFCDLLRKAPSSVLKQLLLNNPHLKVDVPMNTPNPKAPQATALSQANSNYNGFVLAYYSSLRVIKDPVVRKQLKIGLEDAFRTLKLVFSHSEDIKLKNEIVAERLKDSGGFDLSTFFNDPHVVKNDKHVNIH